MGACRRSLYLMNRLRTGGCDQQYAWQYQEDGRSRHDRILLKMIGDPYEELMRSIGTIKPAHRPKGSPKAKSRVGIYIP